MAEFLTNEKLRYYEELFAHLDYYNKGTLLMILKGKIAV
jgi:hypothetical protein